MSGHRFFLESIEPDTLTIEGDDASHAVRVLRIAPGETISISDGCGSVAAARVTAAGRTLFAEVLSRSVVDQPAPRLTVYQGLPKHGKLDDIVQALTQLGVACVVPTRMRRSVTRWDDAKTAAQTRRLRAIAREAAMQSRRAWLPEVGDPATVAGVPDGALILHEEAEERLTDLLPPKPPVALALVVGPEGGLEPGEVEDLERRGCRTASLGSLVLRTQLAPIAAVAVVQCRYGLLG